MIFNPSELPLQTKGSDSRRTRSSRSSSSSSALYKYEFGFVINALINRSAGVLAVLNFAFSVVGVEGLLSVGKHSIECKKRQRVTKSESEMIEETFKRME